MIIVVIMRLNKQIICQWSKKTETNHEFDKYLKLSNKLQNLIVAPSLPAFNFNLI